MMLLLYFGPTIFVFGFIIGAQFVGWLPGDQEDT